MISNIIKLKIWALANKDRAICISICLVVLLGYIGQNYMLWGNEKKLYEWTMEYCPPSSNMIYDKAEYCDECSRFYVVARTNNNHIKEYALWQYLGYQDIFRKYSKCDFIEVSVTKVNKRLRANLN